MPGRAMIVTSTRILRNHRDRRLRQQDQCMHMAEDHDPYSVLGVDRDCDQEALKKRYQVLAKEVS